MLKKPLGGAPSRNPIIATELSLYIYILFMSPKMINYHYFDVIFLLLVICHYLDILYIFFLLSKKF